jgi:ABC-type multidrug transport system fused ATPase/permease subunit
VKYPLIDFIDCSKVNMSKRRSSMAIIRVSGTLRSNLDPFHQHPEKDLEEAVARAHARND